MDSSFYRRSIFDSFFFRSNSALLLVALAFGAYSVLIFGANLSIPLWVFILAVMVGLAGMWVRAIIDHRAIHRRLADGVDSVSREELLKLAAFWPTFGLGFMYFIALTLLFCLATAMKHYEALIGPGIHGAIR
jgi:hypothetical protein